VGHSTGANKVCYYAGTKRDVRVLGVVLAGPMSDRYSVNTDKKNYAKNHAMMKKLVSEGKGNELFSSRHFFPMTPKRWLSLLEPGSKEDVFNYGDTINALSVFARIRKPLLVVFSEYDETADRPIEKIKSVFDAKTRASAYKSVVIPGATHGYTGKEQQFVDTVISWASSI
jgi:pimeloyl-ACP methyl ester carboxylesterase